jgi:type IV secretion system protein VirB10
LGRIDPPTAQMPPLAPDPVTQPSPLSATPLQEIPLQATPAVPPAKTAAQLALERQLSGAVFSSQSSLPTAPATGAMPPPVTPQEPGELSALLRPSVTTAVRAQVLPTQRLLLPKGAFLDCTLETAIDSTLPGMTTCVMATDAFGVDGEVVLMERGTKLVGETRGQVQQGSARVFVLWNEARTPSGVIVPLASPGADELGRAGLPGSVDRHFWERFGAAMLVSVIDGAIQAAVRSSRGSSGTVIVNPAATQDVMTEVLKGTINIPPTVVKHQGDRIQVLVARDLDFRSVYELKSTVAVH